MEENSVEHQNEQQSDTYICPDPVCFCKDSLFVRTARIIQEHPEGLDPIFYEWAEAVLNVFNRKKENGIKPWNIALSPPV